MKQKTRILLPALAVLVLFYTACKKSSVTAAGPSLAPKAVAGQVALNISQSLFGGFGAFDVSGGVNAPSSFAVHTSGKTLDDLTDPQCGTVVDTTVSFSGNIYGITTSIAGHINFVYSCTSGVLSGFTTDDNITIAMADSNVNLTYKVAEKMTLQSLNPTNPDANLSISGALNSNLAYQYTTGTKKSGTEVFNYTLNALTIDPLAQDISGGTATFSTNGSGPKGVWNYQGTIVFKGNHTATVTINGAVYTVNLQTEAVS